MKYVLIAATMLTASLTFAQQKEQRTPEERAKAQSERLTSQLGLSADQQSKIYDINLKEIKESDAVRNNTSLSDDEKKQKLQSIHESRKKAYSSVLTEEQQKKLAEQRPMVRDDKNSDSKPNGDATPEQRAKAMTDKMATDLSLTDQQKTKVYDLNLAHAKKADEIRSNKSLTEDEKQSKLEALRKSEKDDYKSVLTADQLAKLKEMKEDQKQQHQQK